jgi:hypothetical protein
LNNPKVKIEIVNLPELREVTSLYTKATGHDNQYILNKLSINSLFRSIKHTPKASVASITKDLGTVNKPSQLAFNLANKALKGKGTIQQIYELAQKIISARRRSVAYIKAGWVVALRAFGAHARIGLSSKNLAAHRGYGTKATHTRWRAVIFNGAPGAPLVGAEALKKGMDEALVDSRSWAIARLEGTAKKFSARKR